MKSAPRFTDYINGKEMLGYALPYKPPYFTDSDTSTQEAQSQKREEIAIQLGEISSSYSALNEIGKKQQLRVLKLYVIPML